MTGQLTKQTGMSDMELKDLVASSDTSARTPTDVEDCGLGAGVFVSSLFKFWCASPQRFLIAGHTTVLNDARTRQSPLDSPYYKPSWLTSH